MIPMRQSKNVTAMPDMVCWCVSVWWQCVVDCQLTADLCSTHTTPPHHTTPDHPLVLRYTPWPCLHGCHAMALQGWAMLGGMGCCLKISWQKIEQTIPLPGAVATNRCHNIVALSQHWNQMKNIHKSRHCMWHELSQT